MKTKSKIWLGVGAFVVAGTGAMPAGGSPAAGIPSAGLGAPAARSRAGAVADFCSTRIVLAQHDGQAKNAGEGGETKGLEALPPDLAFAVRIALLRGHLLVGDELVKLGQWNAALPHFLHPTEEIYGDIRDHLNEYQVPPFEAALKALADTVKSKDTAAYAKSFKPVNDALAAADAGLKAKQPDWDGFVTETAVETIKSAAGEYEDAIVNGRLAKPVEYQDARGFIWQAQRMIESVAAGLQKKDAAALKQVRAGFAELKKAFPTAMPPQKPIKDHAALLAIVSRIELAAGKLM
jgi:hypothetical protein